MPVAHTSPYYLRTGLRPRPIFNGQIPLSLSGNAMVMPNSDSNVGHVRIFSQASSGVATLLWPVAPPGASGIFVAGSDGVSVAWTANASTHVATLTWSRAGAVEAPYFDIHYEPM